MSEGVMSRMGLVGDVLIADLYPGEYNEFQEWLFAHPLHSESYAAAAGTEAAVNAARPDEARMEALQRCEVLQALIPQAREKLREIFSKRSAREKGQDPDAPGPKVVPFNSPEPLGTDE